LVARGAAAALHALAEAAHRQVACFAHVTNETGRIDEKFEKGEASGSADALATSSFSTAASPGWLL